MMSPLLWWSHMLFVSFRVCGVHDRMDQGEQHNRIRLSFLIAFVVDLVFFHCRMSKLVKQK